MVNGKRKASTALGPNKVMATMPPKIVGSGLSAAVASHRVLSTRDFNVAYSSPNLFRGVSHSSHTQANESLTVATLVLTDHTLATELALLPTEEPSGCQREGRRDVWPPHM
jgi:hypothetical protein